MGASLRITISFSYIYFLLCFGGLWQLTVSKAPPGMNTMTGSFDDDCIGQSNLLTNLL